MQDDFDDLCEALTNSLGPASPLFQHLSSSALHLQKCSLLSPGDCTEAAASASTCLVSKSTASADLSGLAKESDQLRCGLDRLLACTEESAKTVVFSTCSNASTTLLTSRVTTIQESAKDCCDRPKGPLTTNSILPGTTPQQIAAVTFQQNAVDAKPLFSFPEGNHAALPTYKQNGEIYLSLPSAAMTTAIAGDLTLHAHSEQEAVQKAEGVHSLALELSRLGNGLNRLLMIAEAGHLKSASTSVVDSECTSKPAPLSLAAFPAYRNGNGAGVSKAEASVLQMQQLFLEAVQKLLEKLRGQGDQHLLKAGATGSFKDSNLHAHAQNKKTSTAIAASAIAEPPANISAGQALPAGWAAQNTSSSIGMESVSLKDTGGIIPDCRSGGVVVASDHSCSQRDEGRGRSEGSKNCRVDCNGTLLAAPGIDNHAPVVLPQLVQHASDPDASPACRCDSPSGVMWRPQCNGVHEHGSTWIEAGELNSTLDTSDRGCPRTGRLRQPWQQQSFVAPTSPPPSIARKLVSTEWRFDGFGPGVHGGLNRCQLSSSLGQQPGIGKSPLPVLASSPPVETGVNWVDLSMRYCV